MPTRVQLAGRKFGQRTELLVLWCSVLWCSYYGNFVGHMGVLD